MIPISGAGVLAAAKYLNETHVDALGMPNLTYNALVGAGVNTLADLVRADVARIPGIGHGSLLALREAMALQGFTLSEQQRPAFFHSVEEQMRGRA